MKMHGHSCMWCVQLARSCRFVTRPSHHQWWLKTQQKSWGFSNRLCRVFLQNYQYFHQTTKHGVLLADRSFWLLQSKCFGADRQRACKSLVLLSYHQVSVINMGVCACVCAHRTGGHCKMTSLGHWGSWAISVVSSSLPLHTILFFNQENFCLSSGSWLYDHRLNISL